MFKKRAAAFYRGLKTRGVYEVYTRRRRVFLEPIKHVLLVFLNDFKSIPQKAGPPWTQNNGSNCERRILAYKKKTAMLYKCSSYKEY